MIDNGNVGDRVAQLNDTADQISNSMDALCATTASVCIPAELCEVASNEASVKPESQLAGALSGLIGRYREILRRIDDINIRIEL